MSFWIFVFNQKAIEKISSEGLRQAIAESHFHTLCRQYHLDAGLIPPALENLDINQAGEQTSLFFMLRYRSEGKCPIRVYRWGIEQDPDSEFMKRALGEACSTYVRDFLAKANQIIAIELLEAQLQDLGLLLGYELARWAAHQGRGIIRALDGEWYRLNRHAAFMLIEQK